MRSEGYVQQPLLSAAVRQNRLTEARCEVLFDLTLQVTGTGGELGSTEVIDMKGL